MYACNENNDFTIVRELLPIAVFSVAALLVATSCTGLGQDRSKESECTDLDRDGFAAQACGGSDCDDSDPLIHPGAFEACNGKDDDCNGLTDDGPDQDGDGWGSCTGDCDDRDASVYPGAVEICGDGIDQDCDGKDMKCSCPDTDRDGYEDSACGGEDCDDTDSSIHPGAEDICLDGIDQDCDGEDRTKGCAEDEVRMVGRISLGQQVEASMEKDDFAHGYSFHAYEGTVVSLVFVAARSLSERVAIQGPRTADGWGGELSSKTGNDGEKITLDDISIDKRGDYRIVIYRSDGFGDYQLALDCQHGCEVATCPERTGKAPPPVGQVLKLVDDQELSVLDFDTDAGAKLHYIEPESEIELATRPGEPYTPLDMAALDYGRSKYDVSVVLYNGEGYGGVLGIVSPGEDDSIQGLYGVPGSSDAVAIASGDCLGRGYETIFVARKDGSIMGVDFHDTPYSWDLEVHLEGMESIDEIAASDFDGDTIDELAVLYSTSEGQQITILDLDSGGKAEVVDRVILEEEYSYFKACDLDGDQNAEIALGKDAGIFRSDWIDVLEKDGGAWKTNVEHHIVSGADIKDISCYEPYHDGIHALLVLDDEHAVRELWTCGTDLCESTVFSLDGYKSPELVSAVDLDGDTPRLILKSGPYPATGHVIPVVLMVFPPAYRGINTDWPTTVGFGETESHGEDKYDRTVTLNSSVSYGLDGEVPGLFKAEVKSKVSRAVSVRVADFASYSKSLAYSMMQAYPGYISTGGVVFAWTCYDGYIYELHDPQGIIGQDGDEVGMDVPVAIGDMLWDLKRYNENARNLGVEPIEIAVDPGDPSTYPESMVTVEGTMVTEDSLLTPEPVRIRLSDYAVVSWEYVLGEEVTHEESLSMGVEEEGGLTVGPASFSVAVGIEGEDAHTITIGKETNFNGSIGPLFDLDGTETDEYREFYYEFVPFVYRREPGQGKPGYFVQYYYVDTLGPGYP